jgi:putative hydrolase of the HAD superfamily
MHVLIRLSLSDKIFIMKAEPVIKTIFTDIGGVLLTNGWDREARKKAIELFNLDPLETEERHHLTFDTYEVGKLTLDEYLQRLVFYKKRNFTQKDFIMFMYKQSKPFPEMIALLQELKKKYNLKIAVVSNEGRELNNYRIKKFGLNTFIDFFISSSFVHFRKPDADIFKLAVDVAQCPKKELLYIDDRPLFVQVATAEGIRGIIHNDYESTVIKLKSFGLEL